MEIYLVGGAVRDYLLGLPIKDRDWVVVGGNIETMLAKGYKQVGQDFPVFLHPNTKEEYALARTERKTGPGYKGFSFVSDPSVTLTEDLSRRDLTINAIAETPEGKLIDPYQGMADLQHRVLRHVSAAFVEDPVRLLRIARFKAQFAAFGFRVAPETMQLLRTMVQNNEINALTAERVWLELSKALQTQHPSEFFITLSECGALKILFPYLELLFSPQQTLATSLFKILDAACQTKFSLSIRFAILVHGFEQVISEPIERLNVLKKFCQTYRIPNELHDLAKLVLRFQTAYHTAKTPEQVLSLLEKTDAFRRQKRFEEFLTTCELITRNVSAAEKLRLAQQHCAAIKIEPLLQAGLSGIALATALREQRLAVLA